MDSESKSETKKAESTDPRIHENIDRIAYVGIGVYSLINISWIAWVFSGAGFGIFDTAGLIGLLVPFLGLLTLVVYQCSSRGNRFSVLANVFSVGTIGGWFFFVWYIVAAASAAV